MVQLLLQNPFLLVLSYGFILLHLHMLDEHVLGSLLNTVDTGGIRSLLTWLPLVVLNGLSVLGLAVRILFDLLEP